MNGSRIWTAVTCALLASLLSVGPLRAQRAAPGVWTADARAGISVPFGSLGDLVDVGPSFGIGVAREVAPRLALRFDADADFYGGSRFESATALQRRGPDVTLWHLTGSAEVELTDPVIPTPWRITASGGLGLTVFDADRWREPVDNPRTPQVEQIRDFSETDFTLAAGARAAYSVNPRLEVYGSLEWFLAFTDEDATAVFTELSGTDVGPFSSASSFPLTIGVRAGF